MTPAARIAILTSLAYGKQVDLKISNGRDYHITAEDFLYARAMKKCIKLLGKSWSDDEKLYALCVARCSSTGIIRWRGSRMCFNAIFVHGNMVDDTMFYGQGAGRRPDGQRGGSRRGGLCETHGNPYQDHLGAGEASAQ